MWPKTSSYCKINNGLTIIMLNGMKFVNEHSTLIDSLIDQVLRTFSQTWDDTLWQGASSIKRSLGTYSLQDLKRENLNFLCSQLMNEINQDNTKIRTSILQHHPI